MRLPAAVLLAVLLGLAAWARLDRREANPPGFFCDEAAIALNARKVALTGRTLAGERWPLYPAEPTFSHWRSKGIVYQPVFFYTVVPFARSLGLTPATVRLPALMFALLGLWATYALGAALFGRGAGLVAAAILALSPSHVHVSRMGLEPISVLPFLAFGLALLIRGGRGLFAGVVLLGLATYAYPSAKLFVPLLVLAFALVRWSDVRLAWRRWALAAALLAAVAAPNVWATARGVGRERLPTLVITQANVRGELAVQDLRRWAETSSLAARVLDSRPALVGFLFVRNYVRYFSPGYLFDSGDPKPLVHPPDVGIWPWSTAPLMMAGLAAAARRRREAAVRLLLAWLVAAPVSASLTTQNPHALRALVLLPGLALLAALGAQVLAGRGRPRSPSVMAGRVGLALCVAGLAVEHVRFLASYGRDYPAQAAPYWQAGVGEALRVAASARGGSGTVVLTHEIHGAHLFALFYGGVDVASWDSARSINEQLRPYGYACVLPEEEREPQPDDVWILTAAELKRHRPARVLAEIPYPDGRPNLVVVRGAVDGMTR